MGRGFQRHDFIGGGGPGLERLRRAGIGAELTKTPKSDAPSRLEVLRAAMANHDWPAAIVLASKFTELGDEQMDIERGREAILRPVFQRQLGRDPAQLIENAKAALIRRYGNV
jgi:hypothetical protein